MSESFIPIVLCAGFGTRLQPLTRFVPKAAAPIAGAPVAYHSIRRLLDLGFETVHCNTHYLSEFLRAELQAKLRVDGFAANRVRFWHEPDILETAGGIANIVHSLLREEPNRWNHHDVLAIAGDVYAEPPLEAMFHRWKERPRQTAALMTTRRLRQKRPDVTWVSRAKNEVVGFGTDCSPDDTSLEGRLFSTHQIIAQEIILGSPVLRESSRDLFFRASLRRSLHILNVDYPDHLPWFDIGDYSAYAEALGTRCLSEFTLPKRCLIISSSADQEKKKTTGRVMIPASAKSSGDSFRGSIPPDRSTGEILVSKSQSTLASGFGSLSFETVSLEPQWGLLSHLASQPRCGGSGIPVGEVVRELCAAARNLPLSPEEDVSPSLESKKIRLIFSVSGLGMGLSHPILLPLEFFELPNPLEPSLSLHSLYESSQTFFLFD